MCLARGVARARAAKDWVAWHDGYARPGSSLARRLDVVREQVRAALDAVDDAVPTVDVVSLCAGDGRDLLPVVAAHPRRDAVRLLLVEQDEQLVEDARAAAAALGLPAEVVRGDAGVSDVCLHRLPAHVLLACGIFGNISRDDMRRTVDLLPSFLAPRGAVVWTRGRGWDGAEPARLVRRWFAAAGLEEVSYTEPTDAAFRVGVHRLAAGDVREPVGPGVRLFTFT